jgi:hypothetical protein
MVPFTCQLTAELDAFSTRAWKGTTPPGKGCAEFGVTLTVAGGGGGEELTKPQEVQIKQSRTETHKSLQWKFPRRPSRMAGLIPRVGCAQRCKFNGLGMGLA